MKQFIQVVMLALLGSSMSSYLHAEPKKNSHVYFVILAGGNGERLWPLSRRSKPKQLLEMGDRTLLDQAIDRAALLVPQENIWISTTEHHKKNIKNLVGKKIGNIVVEPGSRNTAPAILLSCFELYKQDKNAIVIFAPADPFIPKRDAQKFTGFMEHGIDFVTRNEQLLLFGVMPTYPATGYGYIEFDLTKSNSGSAPFEVTHFHEKPSLAAAKRYLNSSDKLWNIGMFGGKVSVFLDEFKRHAVTMFDGVHNYCYGTGDYNDVPSDSIDYAIMEKSNNVWVMPVDFAWCDVGNIEVFLSLEEEHGDKQPRVLTFDSRNNMVSVSDKLVALVGVDDLCIVQTDDALLITKREKAEHVKKIVQQLKEYAADEYL